MAATTPLMAKMAPVREVKTAGDNHDRDGHGDQANLVGLVEDVELVAQGEEGISLPGEQNVEQEDGEDDAVI